MGQRVRATDAFPDLGTCGPIDSPRHSMLGELPGAPAETTRRSAPIERTFEGRRHLARAARGIGRADRPPLPAPRYKGGCGGLLLDHPGTDDCAPDHRRRVPVACSPSQRLWGLTGVLVDDGRFREQPFNFRPVVFESDRSHSRVLATWPAVFRTGSPGTCFHRLRIGRRRSPAQPGTNRATGVRLPRPLAASRGVDPGTRGPRGGTARDRRRGRSPGADSPPAASRPATAGGPPCPAGPPTRGPTAARSPPAGRTSPPATPG
jgi:hypothetical protein